MPVYIWEGRGRNNQIRKGEMEAASVQEARNNLSRQGIITVDKLKKKSKDLFENVAFLQPRVKQEDIIIFARQFSTMIDAGLPIIQCLDILQAQQDNATFKKMLKKINHGAVGIITQPVYDIENAKLLVELMENANNESEIEEPLTKWEFDQAIEGEERMIEISQWMFRR